MRLLLRMRLRRERVIAPIWIAATFLLAYAGAAGVATEFPNDADREVVLKLAVLTPSLLALRGVPDGASLGSYVYFQVFCYLALLAAFMTTFFVTRHTRADEERGREELIGATSVSRLAPLTATLVVGAAENVVLGLLVALGLIAGKLPVGGSFAAGLAAASVGLCFLGIGAVVAQLAPTSRSANGISAALVGLAFVLRAVGDAAGTPRADGLSVTSAWPSWLSPIGWGQQVFALTRPNLLPLLLSAALAIGTVAVALALRSRRDLGASLLRERSGRASAPPWLNSSFGLAWRQQWPSVVGWAIGGAVLGSIAGLVAGPLANTSALPDTLKPVLDAFVPGGKGEITDLLVAAVASISGVLAAAAGAQAIMRARGEEADGRAELVLSAPISRAGWLLSWIAVAVVSALVVALATGLFTGLSFVGTEPGRFGSSFVAGTAQIPAAIAFIALTTLVFVLIPRATIWLGWGLLAIGLAIGQFGGLLQLPQWLRDASPFTHTPAVPLADADWGGGVIVLAVSAAALVVGVLAARRRELTT